jgi:hypothetical protein
MRPLLKNDVEPLKSLIVQRFPKLRYPMLFQTVDGLGKDAIQLFCAPKPRPGKMTLKIVPRLGIKDARLAIKKRGTIDIEH